MKKKNVMQSKASYVGGLLIAALVVGFVATTAIQQTKNYKAQVGGEQMPPPDGTMQPSSTGTMQPSSTGTMQPSSTGTMQPSSTGTTQPSPTGGSIGSYTSPTGGVMQPGSYPSTGSMPAGSCPSTQPVKCPDGSCRMTQLECTQGSSMGSNMPTNTYTPGSNVPQAQCGAGMTFCGLVGTAPKCVPNGQPCPTPEGYTLGTGVNNMQNTMQNYQPGANMPGYCEPTAPDYQTCLERLKASPVGQYPYGQNMPTGENMQNYPYGQNMPTGENMQNYPYGQNMPTGANMPGYCDPKSSDYQPCLERMKSAMPTQPGQNMPGIYQPGMGYNQMTQDPNYTGTCDPKASDYKTCLEKMKASPSGQAMQNYPYGQNMPAYPGQNLMGQPPANQKCYKDPVTGEQVCENTAYGNMQQGQGPMGNYMMPQFDQMGQNFNDQFAGQMPDFQWQGPNFEDNGECRGPKPSTKEIANNKKMIDRNNSGDLKQWTKIIEKTNTQTGNTTLTASVTEQLVAFNAQVEAVKSCFDTITCMDQMQDCFEGQRELDGARQEIWQSVGMLDQLKGMLQGLKQRGNECKQMAKEAERAIKNGAEFPEGEEPNTKCDALLTAVNDAISSGDIEGAQGLFQDMNFEIPQIWQEIQMTMEQNRGGDIGMKVQGLIEGIKQGESVIFQLKSEGKNPTELISVVEKAKSLAKKAESCLKRKNPDVKCAQQAIKAAEGLYGNFQKALKTYGINPEDMGGEGQGYNSFSPEDMTNRINDKFGYLFEEDTGDDFDASKSQEEQLAAFQSKLEKMFEDKLAQVTEQLNAVQAKLVQQVSALEEKLLAISKVAEATVQNLITNVSLAIGDSSIVDKIAQDYEKNTTALATLKEEAGDVLKNKELNKSFEQAATKIASINPVNKDVQKQIEELQTQVKDCVEKEDSSLCKKVVTKATALKKEEVKAAIDEGYAKASDVNPFDSTQWWAAEGIDAMNAGYVKGKEQTDEYGKRIYDPAGELIIADVITAFYRPQVDKDPNASDDVDNSTTPAYAKEYVKACEDDKLTICSVPTENMTQAITRGELAQFISEFTEQPKPREDIKSDLDKYFKDCSDTDVQDVCAYGAQLKLMGIFKNDNLEPEKALNRAELGAVLSRAMDAGLIANPEAN